MNKKGDVSIVILVFLVLATLSVSLFLFATSKDVADTVIDINTISDVEIQESVFGLNVKYISQSALVKTYDEFATRKDYDYVNNPVLSGGLDLGQFKDLHIKLKENFEKRFKENFFEIWNNHAVSDFSALKKYITKDKLKVNYNEENITIEFSDLNLTKNNSQIFVKKQFDFKLTLDFEPFGITSFEDIYSAKEKCSGAVNEILLKDCLEEELQMVKVDTGKVKDLATENNIATTEKTEESTLIILTTMRKFALDNLREIKFVFVPA